MTRLIFTVAFLLGVSVVLWMGTSFIGTDSLALTVIAVIACVYMVGFIELVQFRQATATLSHALSCLSDSRLFGSCSSDTCSSDTCSSDNSASAVSKLNKWLGNLHPSLQNSVRLRIEGERVALPAPVLSPYLVGLLVMLGLLGTFAGMVDTLKGAVLALEGTTELQAVRAGLAAPIKGLGLAFGTSVAGVAASAMLGLLSTLSRRDRMLATRGLDSKISTVFQEFSLSFNRQETYKALQNQAQAFPEVVDKLHNLAIQMESMGNKLSGKLIASQDEFHQSAKDNYSELANSVGASLRESLSDSARLTSEAIEPVFNTAMTNISEELRSGVKQTQQQLLDSTLTQVSDISALFTGLSSELSNTWKAGLAVHENTNKTLIEGVHDTFNSFNDTFESKSNEVLSTFKKTSASLLTEQAQNDKARLALWEASFGETHVQAKNHLEDVSKQFSSELKQVNDVQQQHLSQIGEEFQNLSTVLTGQWQQAGESSLNHQKNVTESLQQVARDISDETKTSSSSLLGQIGLLLKASESLVQARVDTESEWLNSHDARLNKLSTSFNTGLNALRDAEERRGEKALERLEQLEAKVAIQLAQLGSALEAPMTRLIETASETPRAAAEVISHLRREISNNIERDNTLLQERERIMEALNSVFSSLEQSSYGQRDAVEQLVSSSANMLKDIGAKFTHHVESEVGKLSEISDHFSGSAADMASLGDAFSLSVELFNQSTGSLIENLSRIEESLNTSTNRSDEQMAYYIAQAREIIDQSMLSQQEIIEQFRQLSLNTETEVC